MNKRTMMTVVFLLFLASGSAAQSAAPKAVPVYAGTVDMEPVRHTLSVRGTIVPPERVDVYSTFGGDVVSLNVDEGDRVRLGQAMVRVKRVDPGVRYEPERIDCPLSGTVSRRYVSVGARVTPQTKLFEIVHDDSMLFRAEILEVDLAGLRVGLQGSLRLTNGQAFENVTLGKILPYVDAQKQIVPGEVILPNPDRRLLPNIEGELKLLLDQHSGLTVSRDAVVERKRVKGLFAIRDGAARWVQVTLVSDLGNRLEISGEGLAAGDTVATFGQNSLSDGVRVEVREDLRR